MKAGLRVQILLLLGGLLLLAFLPLYFAMSTYIRVALQRSETESSQAIGRTTAAYVLETLVHAPHRPLGSFLAHNRSEGRVAALAYYHNHTQQGVAGPESLTTQLPKTSDAVSDKPQALEGNYKAYSVRLGNAAVTTVVFTGSPKAAVLNQLLALYMGLVALALLVGTHLTITRWIIRPVSELSLAAKQVLTTTRELQIPHTRSREITELSGSLKTMTERLLDEEAALRKKIQEVETAQTKLQRAQAQVVHSERLASVGQLAAGLAHEVGNPIAAMQGMQDLILTGDLEPEEQLDFIQRMRKETERISGILRQLLQFARPSQHPPGDVNAFGNVEAAITETVTLVSPQPALRDIELSLDLFPDLPEVALSHDQLTQVLLNLIMNAAAACDGKGTIRIRALEQEPGVQLEVEDSGPGIPNKLKETLFEPFVSSKDVGEGTGLGLSVCKGLVEASGGQIYVDYEYADGARFVVRLPAAGRASTPPVA